LFQITAAEVSSIMATNIFEHMGLYGVLVHHHGSPIMRCWIDIELQPYQGVAS